MNSSYAKQNASAGIGNYSAERHQYYFYDKVSPKTKPNRINVDNAWNPIDSYVYGPTRSSVFSQQNQQHQQQLGRDNSRNLHIKKPWDRAQISAGSTPPASITDSFNYVPNPKYAQNQFSGSNILSATNTNPNSKYNTFNTAGVGAGASATSSSASSNYNPYSGSTSSIQHNNNNNNPYQYNNNVDILNLYQTIPTIKSSIPSFATSSSSSSSTTYSLNNNNQRGFYGSKTNANNVNNNENANNNGNYYQSGAGGSSSGRAGGKQQQQQHNHHQQQQQHRLPPPPPSNRKLLLEIYDNETPKLCDHSALEGATGSKTRPCSPLESYVSTGSDMVRSESEMATISSPC